MDFKSIRESKWLTPVQKNAATDDLSKKLRLEKKLDSALRPLMNRMNKDFRKRYAATGTIINFSRYEGEMATILRQHYDRTARLFKGSAVKTTKQVTVQDEIDLGVAEWQADRLETLPTALITTTQRDADKAVRDAQGQLIESDEPLSSVSVAALAAILNRRRLFGRLTGISITETQAAAESTRLIEAEVLSGRRPFSIPLDPFAVTRPREEEIKPASKQWVTVGDSRVRATHTSADRQTVDLDSPFIVGGFPMRHPGDSSLGAPVREWINCRCSSNINIDF